MVWISGYTGNQSTYIPQGALHRLKNLGIELLIIENLEDVRHVF